MRSIVVTEKALQGLLECLVIRYSYSRARRSFFLVVDYWDKDPGSSRAFLKLEFEEVDGFGRTKGERDVLQRFTTDYALADAPSPTVVELVKCWFDEKPKRWELGLGSAFGSIAFRFESAAGLVKNARAKAVEGGWEYYDSETGAPVDFQEPFAG